MAIISFFTICIFLAIAGKNMEVLSYKRRDLKSCTSWLQDEYWDDIGYTLCERKQFLSSEYYDNNVHHDFKLLVRYDIATEKMRKLGYG